MDEFLSLLEASDDRRLWWVIAATALISVTLIRVIGAAKGQEPWNRWLLRTLTAQVLLIWGELRDPKTAGQSANGLFVVALFVAALVAIAIAAILGVQDSPNGPFWMAFSVILAGLGLFSTWICAKVFGAG